MTGLFTEHKRQRDVAVVETQGERETLARRLGEMWAVTHARCTHVLRDPRADRLEAAEGIVWFGHEVLVQSSATLRISTVTAAPLAVASATGHPCLGHQRGPMGSVLVHGRVDEGLHPHSTHGIEKVLACRRASL